MTSKQIFALWFLVIVLLTTTILLQVKFTKFAGVVSSDTHPEQNRKLDNQTKCLKSIAEKLEIITDRLNELQNE